MMDENKLRERHGLFTDTWRFYKKWITQQGPMTEEKWKEIHREAHQIAGQYGYEKLARGLILAVVLELEI